MQNLISSTLRRTSGASLTAFLFVAFAGLSSTAASAQTQQPTRLCPGSSCPQTPTCHLTKGALGAGCIPKSASTVAAAVAAPIAASTAENAMKCRAVKMMNTKGAFSVAGGQHLIRCGTDSNAQSSNAKSTLCQADKACAHGGECTSPMTCAA